MKLKDLTVELSGNDNAPRRTLNIGPLKDGLNFVYGEKGAGKTTLRHELGRLLMDPESSTPIQNKAIACHSISLTVEHANDRYRIARDNHDVRSTTILNSIGGLWNANNEFGSQDSNTEPHAQHYFPWLDQELIHDTTFVGFRDVKPRLQQLYQVLQKRYQVPIGEDAAIESGDGQRELQYQAELQSRIDSLQLEIDKLQTQRTTIDTEIAAQKQLHLSSSFELQNQIKDLTSRLVECDPNRIRAEIGALEQEANRLRQEIQKSRIEVKTNKAPRYLMTLYRLLDEIDQQIREIRVIQSNVQRHRVRLKDEMEFHNGLTIDEENHPYHRAREILRQIETHVNYADNRGDQWLDDHGTEDTQQFSRFLDETCRALRDDLSLLCDELSGQYREIRNRSATVELKELRFNYNHLSELTQQVLARRDQVLADIQTADRVGAETIIRADAEFCQFAAQNGHWSARMRFVGPLTETNPIVETTSSTSSSLQQQQLDSIECRLTALHHSLASSQVQSDSLTKQIEELKKQLSLQPSISEAQWNAKVAQIDSRISALRTEIQPLKLQLHHASIKVVVSHPLLVTACNILQHLTQGDLTRVWLSNERKSIDVMDRHGVKQSAESLSERGLCQLVQLSLVLAANENGMGADAPLILDDLFAELEKHRIDAAIQTIQRWCQQTSHQVVVLTQHRFLADRIPDAPVWEIEPVQQNGAWKPATREMLAMVEGGSESRDLNSIVAFHEGPQFDSPVAEYPQSPLPRPYPLSKYPRTTDRRRASPLTENVATDVHAYHYADSEPLPNVRTDRDESRTSVVSPAAIGDRIEIAPVGEASRIETLSLFDSAQLRALEDFKVRNVGDFLRLDVPNNATELSACYLTGDSLEHYQSAVWLMMWVPGLSRNDSQALVACGISDPEHLLTSNVDSLFQRFARFLRSPDGRQYASSGRVTTRDTVQSWQQKLRRNENYRHQRRPSRNHRSTPQRQPNLRAYSPTERNASFEDRDRQNAEAWKNSPPPIPARASRMRTPADYQDQPRTSRDLDRHDNNRQVAPRASSRKQRESNRKPDAVRHTSGRQSLRSSGQTVPASASHSNTKQTASNVEKLRFYLELTDHIEAAPSIGPKTGARFEAIGVNTIADFLKMTAEALAEKLNYKRLNAKLLRQWQHQARLVCRIPNLRGHDAQLLVGCGIIEAEEIASMRPESLFELIGPFSDSKEGLKIIRNGKKPDMEEITDWIRFAQNNRSLRAA